MNKLFAILLASFVAISAIAATVTFTWPPDTNAYQVVHRTPIGGSTTTITATNNSVVFNNLSLLQTHEFQIKEADTNIINIIVEGENNTGGTNVNYYSTNGVDYMFFNSSGVGEAIYSFTMPQAATIKVWARVNADNGGQDSFYVEADVVDTKGVSNDIFDVAFPEENYGSGWQWRELIGRGGINEPYDTNLVYDVRTWYFPAGQHSLYFRSRERSTEMDKFVITSDISNTIPPSN